MGGCTSLLVNAVTAYNHPTKGTTLLGAGYVRWDKRIEQAESLFNSQGLRKHGVTVEDTTPHDGGKKKLVVDGIDSNLDFVDDKTLSFTLHCPNPRGAGWIGNPLATNSPEATSHQHIPQNNKMINRKDSSSACLHLGM
jgi:hypothetical protein